MSKDALPEKSCQLDSRYWRITNAKGDVEEVQGPGVVGKKYFKILIVQGNIFNLNARIRLLVLKYKIRVSLFKRGMFVLACYLIPIKVYLVAKIEIPCSFCFYR